MSIRTHHVAASLFAGAIALSSLAWLGLQAPTATAACGTGANIAITNPSPGSTLTGSQTLVASIAGSSSMPTGITVEISAPTTQILGQISIPSGNTTTSFPIPWDSTTVVDGGYQFMAIAHYGTNTAYDCPSAAVQYNVLNSTSPTQNATLTASISPNNWQGLPGQQTAFNVSGVYTNQFGTQYPYNTGTGATSGATFVWGTNAGSLSSATQPTAILTAGPTTGDFSITVSVTMNGIGSKTSAAIKINPPSTTSGGPGPSSSTSPSPSATPSPSPTASPEPTDGTNAQTTDSLGAPLTQQQIQQLQTTPTVFRPVTATNSDPIVPIPTLGCIEHTLGARFAPISSGSSQPTAQERLKASQCFSGADRIPSKLAPVEPARIDDVPPETSFVQLDGLKNETITNSKGTKVTAILINGSGTPNSSVFLYIFSDPMVLRAQTDSQGKWSYVLQNPLKPGEHKIYAVAQKDSSSFVRTPALPVAIAAASQGSQDGSLVIEHTWQPAQIAYVAGAAVMVAAGIFLLFRLRRRTHPLAATSATPIQPAAPAAAAAPAPDAHSPETPAAPPPPATSTPAPPPPEHDAQA